MASFVGCAFPAGVECDSSDSEWDIDCCSVKETPRTKNVPDAVTLPEDNVTLLTRAINDGDTETVERLLDNGVDVETRLGSEWTPLMCAVNVANYNMAKLLLDRGASANFSKDHCTVLMASCTASVSEDKISHCVELLLSRSADPNMADRSEMTCLMLAARYGYSKVINLLVSNGADINAWDIYKQTALATAVQYGRIESVLKLLQLGADKTIRNRAGKSPADLAEEFNHPPISRILSSSSHLLTQQPVEKILSEHIEANVTDRGTKLADLELLLHGLGLGHLADIMFENGITWNSLLTIEAEELEKIGITDPEEKQKLLSAVQQMDLEKVDLDTLCDLGGEDLGSEQLRHFILSLHHQCCYLTETLQDVIKSFPSHPSQVVFSLDPKRESQALCNQLVIQTKELQNEVHCLHSLLFQINEAKGGCELPHPRSHGNRRARCFMGVTLSLVGATLIVLFYKAASRQV